MEIGTYLKKYFVFRRIDVCKMMTKSSLCVFKKKKSVGYAEHLYDISFVLVMTKSSLTQANIKRSA